MNQAAIIHRPTSDYIYPSSRNTLELQLITARADADEVELWYWMRYETDPAKIRRQRLHVSLQDALHDYYRTTVCTGQIAAYTRYCFNLEFLRIPLAEPYGRLFRARVAKPAGVLSDLPGAVQERRSLPHPAGRGRLGFCADAREFHGR